MIREEVAPLLRESGFKKRRNHFRRADDAGWQIVDFQASQWGTRDDVRFTINLWVGVPEIAEGPSDAEAHVQTRIGSLMSDGEDHWWELDDGSDAGELGQELRTVLEELALPWLDERSSLDRLVALARERPRDFPEHDLGRFAMLLEQAGHERLAAEIRGRKR